MSVFSSIWTEYGEILRISPYSNRMRENLDQNNSKYGQFLRSVVHYPPEVNFMLVLTILNQFFNRISRPEVFYKKGVLRPGPATLLKKRLWYSCFPANFAIFLRTAFLTEHLRWLLLSYSL